MPTSERNSVKIDPSLGVGVGEDPDITHVSM